MYTVLNKTPDGLYAVCDFSSGGAIEVVSEDDLKLLVVVGLQAKTRDGEPVTVTGNTLNCEVEVYDPTQEETAEEEDDGGWDLSDYGDDEPEEEETVEGEDDVEADFDYGEDEEPVEEAQEEDEGDWAADYGVDKDETPEGTAVSKLYQLLNKEQIDVLRSYYLWYSRRLFSDTQKDDTFGLSSKKAILRKRAALSQLRGNGDYRYAGFLDVGSDRLGYTCSLGHPLRYMHLVWDITVGDIETSFFGEDYNVKYEEIIQSNNCIVFGIKCVGDFFEISPECRDSLQRAQRSSLKDMELLYDIYTTQDVAKVKQSFALMDEVIKYSDKYDLKRHMFGGKDPIIPFSVVTFYKKFREADLIPPKSLVQEIRSCLVGWTDGTKYFNNVWRGELKYPAQVFYDRVRDAIAGKKYATVMDGIRSKSYRLSGYQFSSGVDYFLIYIYLLFTYEICGYYRYTASKDGFSDEGGRDQNKVGNKFRTFHHLSAHTKVVDGEFNMATFKSLLELARVCSDAVVKYKKENYKLPYFYELYGNMGDIEFPRKGYYGDSLDMSSNFKRVMAAFEPDETKRNRMYTLFKIMVNFVFDPHDIMGTLLDYQKVKRVKEFESCVVGTKVDVVKLSSELSKVFTEFDTMFANLQAFAQAAAEKAEADYNRAQEEKKKAEEARKAEVAKEEEERKLAEETKTQSVSGGSASTQEEVIEYLKSADLSQITDSKYDFAKKVLDTLKKSGKAPSSRQFYYLKPLYEAVSGVVYTGEGAPADRVKLEDRPDIAEAINWINYYPVRAEAVARENGVDEFSKLRSILGTISSRGTISERQMKWAETAVMIMTEGKK